MNYKDQMENHENNQHFNENFNKPNDMEDIKSITVKRPTFPPFIDTEILVANLLKRKTKNPKMPNEFFIYRAALVKELKANNYKIKMTKLSTLASESWSQETSDVKSEYRKLARETERKYLNARSLEMLNSTKILKNNDINMTKEMGRKKKISNNNLTCNSDINEQTNKFITNIEEIEYQQQQYPSQNELKRNDFTLMEDNSIFGMRPRYNQNIYLIPQQDKNYSYIDDLSNSTSSENSSPVSTYWSNPSSPLFSSLPPSSTNINEGTNNHFFAPLSNSFYEYYMTINDMSQNYSQFY
ncbi:hypothetical protein C1645_788459 [Glomus cerebriforme]|uniref:HMG box domain-containing protein n=1 Tax=Glomus cerebriforme TaxID=658196 RepID=A0A397SDP5_9GLOM|nr:hypothetical protein C1645_788459 [Glomus cerebriforme]